MIKHVPFNTEGRDFVVGDMHGRFDHFIGFVEGLNIDPEKDRVFSVGDLIDRGPDSAKCLALTQQKWFHAVRGNHEQLLLDSVRGDNQALGIWLQNGGDWALKTQPGELSTYADWIDALPVGIAVGEGEFRFNIVHAEVFCSDAGFDAGQFQLLDALWGRSIANAQEGSKNQDGLSMTYCGHTVVTAPKRRLQQVFIDTGCGFPEGFLTMVEPATGGHWIAKD